MEEMEKHLEEQLPPHVQQFRRFYFRYIKELEESADRKGEVEVSPK